MHTLLIKISGNRIESGFKQLVKLQADVNDIKGYIRLDPSNERQVFIEAEGHIRKLYDFIRYFALNSSISSGIDQVEIEHLSFQRHAIFNICEGPLDSL